MSRKLVSFDWAMKKILRQKDNFDILEGFLSELFRFDIKIVEILESEANQESENDKFNRVDLLAKDNRDELILIEVQYDSQQDYFHRMLYGASKLICEYMEKGEDYGKVKKVYSVNIIYFALAKGKDYLYYGKTIFYGQNEPDEIFELSNLQQKQFGMESVHQIFPEYFVIRVNKFNDKTKNRIDEWIYFLKNEMIRDDFKAKGLKKAKETLDIMKLNDKERIAYNRKLENKSLEKSLFKSALMEHEYKTKIEIAKNLLDILDVETISIKTGLSIEEIEELKRL